MQAQYEIGDLDPTSHTGGPRSRIQNIPVLRQIAKGIVSQRGALILSPPQAEFAVVRCSVAPKNSTSPNLVSYLRITQDVVLTTLPSPEGRSDPTKGA